MKTLAIVVPCYNEEAMLDLTVETLTNVIEKLIHEGLINSSSFMLLVNDGSKDKTWSKIAYYYKNNKYVCGLNLAGNVGHQNALMAGLTIAKEHSDIIVSIDADLQDDVNVIHDMIIKNLEGFDIIYGVRNNRDTDSLFKRLTAQWFYSFLQHLGVRSVYNHADYRLMSKRAVDFLCSFRERNLYLRGMVPLIGYKTTKVYYKRTERVAGESKYPLAKMVHLAVDGITSLSVTPVRMVFFLGLLFLLIAFCIFMYVFYSFITHQVVPGWSSLMLSVWFCSGSVLLCLGIIGEYIGKIYIEVKDRPRFNVEKILLNEAN